MNRPRLLLLEDDAVSRAYLREALALLPVEVDAASTCAQAAAMARPDDALWLFDAHLPDGDAADLLARLRARGLATTALVLTAATEPSTQARLLAAGYARVLAKPIDGASLRAAVHAFLQASADWDDTRALPALGGRAEALQALRDLFLRDLPGQMACVREAVARGDAATTRAELHRLKGGCGFVGATGMLAAVATLDAQPLSQPALDAFLGQGARLLPRPAGG